MTYIPYVYKWVEQSTGKWYIGSRTKKDVNPFTDNNYLTSSKIVRELIKQNPTNWKKSIICVSSNKDFIIKKETELLMLANAKADPMSYNQHNGNGMFIVKHVSKETRLKMSIAKKGKATWNKGIAQSEETKQKISNTMSGRPAHNKGIPMPEEQRLAMIGKHHSEERKANMSESLQGKTPWNKGLKLTKKGK